MSTESNVIKGAVIFQILFITGGMILGTWCVNYDLLHLFHKTIPTFWAFILNLITGGSSIVAAIVIKILTLLKVLA